MKKLKRPFKIKNYIAVAFAVPFLAMLVLMLIRQFQPFGNYSMLYSDMYHQYYPFFVSFRRALLSGQSLLYNWDVGMGMDYLGLASYYLASPLNLFSVLLPEEWMLGYFSMLMPIKLGFASMFFAIFLKKIFGKNDISIALFGGFYALCAWALGYQWNIMWLDTFALLPLVALGTICLVRDKKFILYTVTLFFSIFANYYIGLFTCIFVFLLFIIYEVCRWQGFKAFFASLVRIAFFSVLAIGMTLVLELPALGSLQTTQSSVNSFPSSFRLNIVSEHNFWGLLKGMAQVAGNMNGGISPTFKEGLPNVYCGVFANVFLFLFLTFKQIKLRDKICAILLLCFINVSFLIRQLDYIWHGFHFTNMIPYRFSFLYSFVMLYAAYRVYLLRNRLKLWQILVAGVMAIGLLFCYTDWTDIVFWSYNCVFLLLYLSILIYSVLRPKLPEEDSREARADYLKQCHSRKQFLNCALPAIIAVELVLNLVNFGANFPGTNITNYPKGTADAQDVISYMHQLEEDNPFYRAETTHSQTLNDGALNGYHGVTTFTSSANVRVTEFMQALGYAAKNTYNRYCFEESSPVSNLFLSLKYMIDRDGNDRSSRYFETVYQSGKVSLLENNAYLPLGFLANSELADLNFSQGDTDPFGFQNALLRAASGLEADVWWPVLGSGSVEDETATLSGNDYEKVGRYTVTAGEEDTTFVLSYIVPEGGFACTYLTLPRGNFSVWLNGKQLYSESYSIPQMLAIGDVQEEDEIQIKVTCKAKETSAITVRTSIMDDAPFRDAVQTLKTSPMHIATFTNTDIRATIDCANDGLLYTSIPQDGNWHVLVDGQPAEIQLIGDCMIGVSLSEGQHTLQFYYENRNFVIGGLVSLGCLAIFTVCCYLHLRPKKKR